MNISPKRTLLLCGGVLGLLAAILFGLTKKPPPQIPINSSQPPIYQSSSLIVEKIIDGDTFVLSDGRHVRLLGIDTPETGEPYSDSAKAFADSVVIQKQVHLEFDKSSKDDYGRTLAYLYIDSLCYNELSLRRGFATIYLFRDNSRYAARLIAAQNEARRARRGLWSMPPPQSEDYYVASAGSYRFHRPLCPSIKNINPQKARRFQSRNQALDLGLSPCRRCRP